MRRMMYFSAPQWSVGCVALVLLAWASLATGCGDNSAKFPADTETEPADAAGESGSDASPTADGHADALGESDSAEEGGGNGDSSLQDGAEIEDASAECIPPAGTPTWNGEVAAILEARCGLCHAATPQFGAPFPLTSYAAATAEWPPGSGKKVFEGVASALSKGIMPPPSQPPLAAHEKDTVMDWATGCAPEGSAGHGRGTAEGPRPVPVPDPPEDADKIDIRAGGFTVPKAQDSYVCFPYTLDFDGDDSTSADITKHIVRFDFEVNQAKVVHHIVLYADPQKAFPDTPSSCTGMPPESFFLYAWAPGGQPLQFPDGLGLPVRDGDRVLLQLHYNNFVPGVGSLDLEDDSGVLLYVTEPRPKEVGMVVTGPVAFSLPALTETKVSSQCRLPYDVTFFASMPHMHQLGKTFKVEVEQADGAWKTLIDIANWSFADQPFYSAPLEVKAGERLVTECTFQNPNGFNVFAGEGTNDEMCFNFAYHYPPLNKAFCDEALDEAAGFNYVPGACAGEDTPDAEELGDAEGGIKLTKDLGFTPGDVPPSGRWALEELHMVLPQAQTIVGTVDIENTSFAAKGFASLDGNTLTLDVDALGKLVTESGATIPYDISVSESGTTMLDEQGRIVLEDGSCSDSDMPFRWLQMGQVDQGLQVALLGLYYELFNVTLVFETRWAPLTP